VTFEPPVANKAIYQRPRGIINEGTGPSEAEPSGKSADALVAVQPSPSAHRGDKLILEKIAIVITNVASANYQAATLVIQDATTNGSADYIVALLSYVFIRSRPIKR
jgi:hypothetical protein